MFLLNKNNLLEIDSDYGEVAQHISLSTNEEGKWTLISEEKPWCRTPGT